jgi:ribosomal protein S27AE
VLEWYYHLEREYEMTRNKVASTQVECDTCGCDQFVAYFSDTDPAVIYVECDGCGASVVTARAEA